MSGGSPPVGSFGRIGVDEAGVSIQDSTQYRVFLFMASILLTPVFWAIHWGIVLPAALIISTPYILVASLFRPSAYPGRVYSYYKSICQSFAKFWSDVGWEFAP